MIDRTLLIERYLALQTHAAKLGIHGTPHLTRDMSADEIVRRGVALAERIRTAEAERDKTKG